MLVQRIKVAEDQVDDKQCGGGGSSSKQWFKLQTQCALISASHQLVGSLTLKKWIYFLVKYFLNRCSQFNQFSASLRSRWICVAQKLIKPLLPTKQIRSKPFDASLRPFLKNASEKKKNPLVVTQAENPGEPLWCRSYGLQNAVLWLLGRSANKCHWHISVLLTLVRIHSSRLKKARLLILWKLKNHE